MSITSQPMLSHVGLFVWDMQKMVNFYVDLFGLKVTDKGRGRTFRNDLVFLSSHPDHHHQLVLSSGRAADATFSTVMQLSFKVQAIDDLRRLSPLASALGASKPFTLNHGNALSIYFRDPEDNTVEVYFDTPYYVSQPHGDSRDLSKSDDEILRETETEAACRADPTFMPIEDWKRDFSERNALD